LGALPQACCAGWHYGSCIRHTATPACASTPPPALAHLPPLPLQATTEAVPEQPAPAAAKPPASELASARRAARQAQDAAERNASLGELALKKSQVSASFMKHALDSHQKKQQRAKYKPTMGANGWSKQPGADLSPAAVQEVVEQEIKHGKRCSKGRAVRAAERQARSEAADEQAAGEGGETV